MRQPYPDKPKSAYTLIEIMVVLVIIGTLMVIGLPNALKNKSYAEDSSAISKAELIDTAKGSFALAIGRRNAETQWTNASGNEARYALLKPYLSYPPPTLADFTPAGYTISLTGLFTSEVSVTRDGDGKVLRP